MGQAIVPQVRAFSRLEPYEQPEPGIARFHWILKQDEIPGLCSGHVELEGPIHKTPAVHADFDQTYLVYAGSGTVHLDDRSYRITEPSAVLIPHGTRHSVELQPGETIRYVFVNHRLG